MHREKSTKVLAPQKQSTVESGEMPIYLSEEVNIREELT